MLLARGLGKQKCGLLVSDRKEIYLGPHYLYCLHRQGQNGGKFVNNLQV